MSEITQHAPGSFCWTDLSTSDQNDAKRFYTALFDWTINDMPMGPDSVYTMLQIRGKDVAALSQIGPEQKAQGIPPHWQTYVAVADADATARRATELGGKLIAPPFDVFDAGRMAIIQDPTGAIISIWQARKHIGTVVLGEAGTPCWFELATRDTKAAAAFYTGLFGWTTKSGDVAPMEYTEWSNDGTPIGGMMTMAPEWGNAPPHWGVYFLVDNCDASAEKAQKLGGKIMVPPMDIPKVGRFALLADPQGAHFSIITMSSP